MNLSLNPDLNPSERWGGRALTCSDGVHVFEASHDFVRDEVLVVPHHKVLLPQKLRQRLAPLLRSADARVGVLLVPNLGRDVGAAQVEDVLERDASWREREGRVRNLKLNWQSNMDLNLNPNGCMHHGGNAEAAKEGAGQCK